MESSTVLIIAAFIMLIMLFLKVPVFISLLTSSALYCLLTPSIPIQIMAQRVVAGMENIPLLAIPFFVCSGIIMNYSGVTKRVIRFCDVIISKLGIPGGLGQVTVLTATVMGGLSGSNLADAAMQAKMLVPEMEKKGFSKEFSSVLTAVSAMITPLIPPGIAMIIYGSISNVSVGKLFVAGFGVGALLCISLMIFVMIISIKRGYQKTTDIKIQESFLKTMIDAVPSLLLPIVIIGGIRFGVFTPTEAGSAAIVYALILALIYREMTVKDFIKAIKETCLTTASIMLIIGAASAFAWILTREQVPQALAEFMVTSISSKYIFLILVNLFLIGVGMFVEGNASMIVLVPLLVPVARAFGISDIQFAMVFIFNSAIGCITPPVGTLMLVTCGITKCKIAAFIKESVPFYAVLLIVLLLLTFVPVFSTGIVDLIY
ncbi:MAG: TRAP transporter large permease [Elusimicrobiota bacterium]|jgi:tripartite ATP-independent transporter DctM subunit|nr:TRAP transporter large permease [Elusimicrobiota bacterium]